MTRTRITQLGLGILMCAGLLHADEVARRLQASANVLNEIMAASDKGIPQDLLDKATCMVVVPGLKKGAFIFGGKYGRGFMVCRKEGAGWSAPAAIRVEGGSFGLQIGGSETDVIMLVMNKSGADKLLGSKFTLGADASVAAGPVGRTSSAETDARMTAEILTWSRSRGVFAGIALQGATLRPEGGWNQDMYGKELSNREIVMGPTKAPPSAAPLLDALNKYSSRKSA
jgi:lipid-binding SYLF domain-containing protein